MTPSRPGRGRRPADDRRTIWQLHYSDASPRQIWIAGGVGLSQFVARLEELAARGGRDRPVDLFFSAKLPDPDVVARISGLAEAAGVRVNVSANDVDGHLDRATVGEAIRDWRRASVWFRGPAAFGASIRNGFERAGGSAADFHQGTFEFR